MATASILAAVAIAALLAGGAGGVLVYRQIEYGTPPDWQVEIISRFSITYIGSVAVNGYQFEYQGNAEWTDLYGSGGVSDVGMWSLLIDINSSSIDLKHTRLMTLLIAGQRSEISPYYWVLGSIVLPASGCTFSYDGTSISTDTTTWMQLEIATSDYHLMTHASK